MLNVAPLALCWLFNILIVPIYCVLLSIKVQIVTFHLQMVITDFEYRLYIHLLITKITDMIDQIDARR